MTNFPKILKDLREEKGISQKELGEEINVDIMTISRWERDLRVPNINYLVLLAKFFNVTTDYLVGMKDE